MNGDFINWGFFSTDAKNPEGLNGDAGTIIIIVQEGDVLNEGEITVNTYGGKASNERPEGGSIIVSVAFGDFTNNGIISADVKSIDGANGCGGNIQISVQEGDINISGSITADSHGKKAIGNKPKGGSIVLDSDQHITITGTLSAIWNKKLTY